MQGPLERDGESLLRDGLEQIVERGDLECSDGVLVVSGHEDHRRHALCSNGVDDREAVGSRHLHVEKHQVRSLLPNQDDRFSPVSGFRNGSHLRLAAEQQLQPLTGKRLVIHYENFQLHGSPSGGTVRIGNVIVTCTPRVTAGSTVRRALSPYSRARRFFVFVSPIPKWLGVGESSPGPSSDTISVRDPLLLLAATSIVTASSLWPRPWRT